MTIVSSWGVPTVRAEIGRIRVPENRASGSTRQIELAFVRIPALKPSSRPPIVWLSGGPGDSGIGDLDTPALRLFLELRRSADVIVLDQRGTGLSVPRLDCPGTFHFPMGVVLDRERAVRALEAAARACSERWRAQGVDVASYNARESAEDVEDLRRALGVPRVSLLAGSYGTHLALAVVRAHDDRLDRAVLIGVVGPDHLRTRPSDLDAELAAVARIASAGRDRQKAIDLLTNIRTVRDRLAAQPASVPIKGPEGEGAIALGPFDLDWFTKSLLSSRETIAHLPAVFEAMASGDFRELASASALWRSSAAPSAGRFTPRCAAGLSRERAILVERERQVAAFPDATDLADERVCRAWGVEPLPDDFRAPVRSELPMLLVSGTLDGVTPESNAAEVQRSLPRASLLVIEGGTHSLLGFGEAASRDAIVRFFEGGARASDRRIALTAIEFERFQSPVAARESRLAGMASGGSGSPAASPFQF